MTVAVKVFAEDRAAAEGQGAVWVGPGSAWWPRIPPPSPSAPGKRARLVPRPETKLRSMLKAQPGIAKAAREMLAGKPIADGTAENVESVATLLVEATRVGK